MKARFTDEQIIAMIKEQEAGEKTADVCRRHGISSATFYKYKSKYGGMKPSDAKKLNEIKTKEVESLFTIKSRDQRDNLIKTIKTCLYLQAFFDELFH